MIVRNYVLFCDILGCFFFLPVFTSFCVIKWSCSALFDRKDVRAVSLSYLKCKVIGDGETGFGILVTLPSGKVRRFESLTFDMNACETLAERVNRLEVSECHLYEILDDFLS